MKEEGTILAPGALEDAQKRALELKTVKASEKKHKRLIPLNNWVLIRKQKREAIETDGGVVQSVDAERSDVGTVVAVAPNLVDSCRMPLDLVPGDIVLYTHFSLTLEDVQELTGDDSLQTVRGEEIYFKIVDTDEELECT